MPVKSIRRDNVDLIRDRLEKRLAGFGPKLNLKAHIGSMRFTEKNVVIKLTLSVIDESGVEQSPDSEAFTHYSRMYGLSPALLNKSFHSPKGITKITGYRPRASVNKFIFERGGKKYVCPFTTIKSMLSFDKRMVKYVDEKARVDFNAVMGQTPVDLNV